MQGNTALVTGGCGFVGRHAVKRLVDRGYRVTVVDDLSTGLRPEAWPAHLSVAGAPKGQVTFHLGDVRDYVREATPSFDLIFHLAAVVGGRMTIEGDPLKVATDLAIDAMVLNWITKQRNFPGKVLYFSSSAAYPIHLQTPEHHVPLSEDMIDFDQPLLGVPDLTYGWSKLTGEFLARHAVATYGLDVVIYRPFSGYGEDQDLTYPFPSVIRRVGRRESPLVVWGSGNQLRDFIYIEDVMDAIFASAFAMTPGSALNLGSGVGTTFRELAQLACRVIGHDAPVVNDATKPEGVFGRVGECSRMFQYYRPETNLEDGIRKVYDYQRKAGILP